MKLTEILAIAGTAGLHKYVASGRAGGIIVESLNDNKRTMVSGAAKVSALGDIAVFTESEEVPLADILTNIYKIHQGEVSIGGKSSNSELASFIESVLPEYDRERVHMSDVKKIANWYNILVRSGMTDFSLEQEAEQDSTSESASDEAAPVKVASPKKSPVSKSVAPKSTPKASGSKVKATKSTTVRKSQ
ncbi:MAG: DUF5606 domain-containing protein [Rikenellaceae bacterium]